MVSLSADVCVIAITFLSLLGMYLILCLYKIAFTRNDIYSQILPEYASHPCTA